MHNINDMFKDGIENKEFFDELTKLSVSLIKRKLPATKDVILEDLNYIVGVSYSVAKKTFSEDRNVSFLTYFSTIVLNESHNIRKKLFRQKDSRRFTYTFTNNEIDDNNLIGDILNYDDNKEINLVLKWFDKKFCIKKNRKYKIKPSELYTMYYLKEMTQTEIAEKLGVSKQNISLYFKRCEKILNKNKKELQEWKNKYM